MTGIAAEALLKEGDVAGALRSLQEAVRAKPADAKLRVFLFQLLAIAGEWDRALTQLDVCADLDAAALPMREMYAPAIACERLREQVFAGAKSPLLFGEPETWSALLIEALARDGRGESEAAARLRAQAFDAAPPSAGALDGERFEWIADADMRLGPVLEAIVNNKYTWVPFSRLQAIRFEAPADLRDCVWLPGQLRFANGGEALALIPVRYPGSHASADGAIRLARKTEWRQTSDALQTGTGQRLLATDGAEVGLLDVRSVAFG